MANTRTEAALSDPDVQAAPFAALGKSQSSGTGAGSFGVANPPLRGQVVAHLGGRQRNGGVEVFWIDSDPLLDDLGGRTF